MIDYAPVGLIGKHPAYGDFLSAGLSDTVSDGLAGWLDQTLSELRDHMGNDWAAFWDGAQDLRFWIGRAMFGATLAGVLRPSRDRVGRRYPFLLLAEGVDLPAPVVEPDQGLWTRLETCLQQMEPGEGARALLTGIALDLPAETAAQRAAGPTIWAHHPEGDLSALLRSAGPVAAERAETARSHFWAPGRPGRAAIWLSDNGLPSAGAFGWALAGTAQQAATAPQDASQPAATVAEGEAPA